MQAEDNKTVNNPKRRPRPTQMLYVPPAQRNMRTTGAVNTIKPPKQTLNKEVEQKESTLNDLDFVPVNDTNIENALAERIEDDIERSKIENEQAKDDEKTLVIMLQSIKTAPDKTDLDVDQEEMQRAIVNINRKSRPLIKHVNVGKNDVLHIDVNEKEHKKSPSKIKIPTNNIDSWEDLLNEDDGDIAEECHEEIIRTNREDSYSEEDTATTTIKNKTLADLEHVIELYDFPASFKSQDIMQLYHDVHKDTYLKWCDDTHALMVFTTPALAQKALNMNHDIIKSRPLCQASQVAVIAASKCDLKPAMKRPPTTMQTARRLITSHLGTKSRISKEEQEKEREMLKQAKALKLAQKQSEKDAWDGNPRPSTA